MYDVLEIQCPWCFERLEIALDMTDWGEMVQDCDVCCHPMRLVVRRDEHGDPVVDVDRSG